VSRTKLGYATSWSRPNPAGLPLIVVFSPAPAALGWLASNLAARLPAAVYVCASSPGSPPLDDTLRSVRDHAATRSVDVALLGLVAEDTAAPRVADGMAVLGTVTRLALVSPVLDSTFVATADGAGFPPTLLQFARDGVLAADCELFAARLKESAVAVRSADYAAPADGWARRSRVRAGSAHALDDLVAFFERGLGTASTFQVIPGWDLH
jgi:acetyl esterase/lipase